MKNRITPEQSRSCKPPSKPGVYWVSCLKGNTAEKFLIYSNVAQGLDQHWLPDKKRTVPCFTNHDLCPGGHSEKNRKWRCYVFAYSYSRHEPVFIQLTKDAWLSWLRQCREGQGFRGQTINVHRTFKDNGRLWVEVEDWRPAPQAKILQDEDCIASVYSMWHWSPADIHLGADLSGEMEITRNWVKTG